MITRFRRYLSSTKWQRFQSKKNHLNFRQFMLLSLKEIKYPIFPKDLLNYLKKSPIYFKGIFPNS